MDSIFKLALVLSAVDHLTGPLRDTARQLETVDGIAKRARGLKEMGRDITVAGAATSFVAAKMRGALGSLVDPAMAVEDALAMVATALPPKEIEQSLKVVRQASRAWALQHDDDATKFIQTTYQMVSAGLALNAAVAATRTAMTVSKATMGESMETANLLATVYKNLGNQQADATTEIARIGDVLTGVQNKYQIATMGQLADGLNLAARNAGLFRMDLIDTANAIGMLNDMGATGSIAGTTFNAMISNMGKASKELHFQIARTSAGGMDFIGTIANMEKRFGSLEKLSPRVQQKFQDLFGDQGNSIARFLGKSKELHEMLTAIAADKGAAGRGQAIMENTGSAQLRIILRNINDVAGMLGEHVLPILKEMKPPVIAIVQGFGNWVKAHPGIARVVVITAILATGALSVAAAVLTAAGALMIFGGHGLIAFSKFGSLLASANGRLLEFGSQVLSTARFRLPLMMQWLRDGGPGFFITKMRLLASLMAAQVANGFRAGIAAASNFASQLLITARITALNVVAAIRAATAATWQWTAALLANPIGMIIAAVIALATGIYLIVKNWQVLADFYESVWAKVKAVFSGGIVSVLQALMSFTPTGIIRMAIAAVAKLLRGTTWFNEGVALIQGLVDGIKSKAAAAWAAVAGIGTGIKDRFKTLLGIHSPSLVFMDLGSNVVAGLARGVQAAEGMAVGRVARLGRALTATAAIAIAPTVGMAGMPAASSAPATYAPPRGGASTAVHIHYNPQITIGSGADAGAQKSFDAQLREHARQIEQMVRDIQGNRRRDY